MASIDDSDFLTNRAKQLTAVQELAHLRIRILDLQSELLTRMHERRQLIQRLAEDDFVRQQEMGRSSRAAAEQRARASDEVRSFDQHVASLRDKIRRLDIDVERWRLSLEVAIAGSADRAMGLLRGAA